MTSSSLNSNSDDDVKRACSLLLEKYPNITSVIVTIGSKGVIYANRLADDCLPVHVMSEKVNVVDSTVNNFN